VLAALINRILIAGIALACTGCDTISGLQRRAAVQSLPVADCAVAAIGSVEGVRDVKHRSEVGGRPLTLRGLKPPDQIERYSYRFSGLSTNLYFLRQYDGKVDFHSTLICMNCVPPQEDIDAIRPVMRKVEAALASQCGLAELPAAVRESCTNVSCGG
jgi:hypothetical protein